MKMRCPECFALLHSIGLRHYETLIEHVSDPNADWPAKEAFGCISEGCSLRNLTSGTFYDDLGDVYSRSYDMPHKQAVFSWAWWYDLKRPYRDFMNRTGLGLKLLRLRFFLTGKKIVYDHTGFPRVISRWTGKQT